MSARLLAALLTLALFALACDRSEDETVEVTVDGSPVPSETPTATATAPPRTASMLVRRPEATPDPDVLDPDNLAGFTHPVAGACLPYADSLMPNWPRAYRNGVHEGVDIYPGYACAHVELNTPALAMYDGVVVRADLDYVDITVEQIRDFAAQTARDGYTAPEILDVYRGRQVWIDHGSGVVARYAHLESIADGIEVGVQVTQGQHVGGLGESGTPESQLAPGTDIHLHYEVRIGDSFLGAGLPPDVVRGLYERLFSNPSVADATGAPPPVFRVYTVEAGDTVQSIAERFEVGPEHVVWNNAGIASADDELEEGLRVRVPGVAGIIHVVTPGETLGAIAARYGANVGSIVSFGANGLSNPNLLRVGATILVPGGRLAAPVPTPTLAPTETATPEPTPTATPAAGEEAADSE